MSGLPTDKTPSHVEAVTSMNEKMGEAQIIKQTKEANDAGHALSVMDCVRNYPMTIFWSLMVSMCVVMEDQFSSIDLSACS